MQKLHLSRVKDYGRELQRKGISDPTRYSSVKTEAVADAKKAIRENGKNTGRHTDIEKSFFERGIELWIKERLIGIEISRALGPENEDIRFFGEILGVRHNYGSYRRDPDLISINPSMATRSARATITEQIDCFEKLEKRIKNPRQRRKLLECLVAGALRKTKTPNLEDHRIMADTLEQVGILLLGREIDRRAKDREAEEVFEELVERNVRITVLHETRHRMDRKLERPEEEHEQIAHLTELGSSLTALGITQLPINRNRLLSQNPNQRGAELLLEDLSRYFGLYGIRNAAILKSRINDIFDFDAIIFCRAAQAILESKTKKGIPVMKGKESEQITERKFLEGKLRDYVFGH